MCERNTAECSRIMSSYKFYIAIENSVCDEYVTEKYYDNALLQGLVPIVAIYPGTKPEDVRRMFIPGSYINILDFQIDKEE